MATTESLAMVQEFYIAYYGRPADPSGLTYWADRFDASDNLDDVLAAFGESAEFTAGFGSLTDSQLVNNLYQQMFGRDAETEGLAFYTDLLETGAATLASIAKQIVDGASGDDVTILANKATVAQTYTDLVTSLGADYDADDIADAKALLDAVDVTDASVTDGNTAAETLVAADVPAPSLSIADVTVAEGDSGTTTAQFTVTLSTAPGTGETVTVDYATADGTATTADTDYTAASGTLTFAEGETSKTIDVSVSGDTDVEVDETFTVTLSNVTGTIGEEAVTISDAEATGTITNDDVAAGEGETFTLTTGTDLVPGTSADDTINGYVGTNPISGDLENTAQSVDIIDGGAGNDTFNFSSNEAGGTFGMKVSNVEVFNFTQYSTAGFNASNVTGLETFNNVSSIDNVDVTGLGNVVAVGVDGVNGNETNIDYTATAVEGGSDEQVINLNNVTDDHVIDFNNEAIELITIDSSTSESKVILAGAHEVATKMTITGDADLTLKLADSTIADTTDTTTLKTIDALALTGDLTLDAKTEFAALNQNITTGTGDDKVTIDNVTKDDVVDMGEGDDKLVLTMDTDLTTSAAFTNVETIEINAGANVTVDLEKSTELTAIEFGAGASTWAVTVRDLVAGVTTVNFNGTKTTVAETFDGVDFKLKSTSGTADALTVNVNANSAFAKADGKQVVVTGLTANGIETLTINTKDLGADDADTTGLQGGVIFNAFAADKLQTLNVVSDTYVDLDVSALDASVHTVDASEASGGIDLNLSAIADVDDTGTTKAVSVTTGDGDDTLTGILTVASVKNTINTGAGDDTVTVVAISAVDQETLTLNTGDGDDAVTVTGGDEFEEAISIDLGAGDDTYTTAGAAVSFTTASTIAFGDGTGDTLKINTTAPAVADFSNATITGLEKVTLQDGDYYFSFETLDEAAIEFTNVGTGDAGVIIGTSSGDIIALTVDGDDQFTHNALKGIDFIGDNNLDNVSGGGGDDTITGNTDANTIIGGAGTDALAGAAGVDEFFHNGFATDGYDTFSDFDWGGGGTNDNFNFVPALLSVDNSVTTAAAATVTALAADTAFAVNAAVFLCAEQLAVGTTATTAIANAVTELADGTDVGTAAAMAAGDSFLLLMTDATNYFMFNYVTDATVTTTTAADLTLLGVFDGLDAANAAAGDLT